MVRPVGIKLHHGGLDTVRGSECHRRQEMYGAFVTPCHVADVVRGKERDCACVASDGKLLPRIRRIISTPISRATSGVGERHICVHWATLTRQQWASERYLRWSATSTSQFGRNGETASTDEPSNLDLVRRRRSSTKHLPMNVSPLPVDNTVCSASGS